MERKQLRVSTVVEVLKQARGLIEDPRNWVQGNFAVAEGDAPVPPSHWAASRWCALGAIKKFADSELRIIASARIQQSAQDLYGEHIEQVNDDLGHAEVMRVFDLAIQDSEKC